MTDKKPATWFPTLTPELANPPPGTAKAKKNFPRLPRFPEPLRRRLCDAIDDAEGAIQLCYGTTDWKPKLDRWRELNSIKPEEVTDELLDAMRPFQKLIGANDEQLPLMAPLAMAWREGMSSDVWKTLERLDKVFSDVHNFHPKQAICDGLPELVNAMWRTGKVNEETKRAKEYMRDVRYFDAANGAPDVHGTKGFHRAHVINRFGVSTGTLQKITKELREELNSQNRTEK